MTNQLPSSADLAAGLGIDRMKPPAIEAFFRSLPRRVIAALGSGQESREPDTTGSEDYPDGPVEGSDVTRLDELVALADAIGRVVERAMSVGFSAAPDDGVSDRRDRLQLSDEIETQLRRIETGANEVAQRLAGLSSTAWDSEPGLLADMRDGVIEVAKPLRQLERHDPDEGEGQDSVDPAAASRRSARRSREVLPQDQADIEAAQEAIETANNASPDLPAPPATDTGE